MYDAPSRFGVRDSTSVNSVLLCVGTTDKSHLDRQRSDRLPIDGTSSEPELGRPRRSRGLARRQGLTALTTSV